MHKLLLTTLVVGLLSACSDRGVVVADNNNGDGTTGGTTGTATGATTGGTGTTTGATTGTATGNTDAATNLDPAAVFAARFLNQATFGATEQSINDFVALGNPGAWIDDQFSQPTSVLSPYTRTNSNGSGTDALHEIWWNNALGEPDQLRQRVSYALSQIFVVSDVDAGLANAQYGMADYYDMLSRNAFGNFRTLLEEVTLHPVMGAYLSMVLNERPNVEQNIRPDENYARELLQLFSIGLFNLNTRGEPIPLGNPQPSYSQETIEQFARVFTGWNYPTARRWNDTNITGDFFIGRMVANEAFHDTTSKTLLNGAVSSAGWTAQQDLSFALDNVFNHPNVGPFISKQLIQRLVTSNPSPEYVERITLTFNNNGNGVRGDMRSVVRAILLDDEARNGHLNNPEYGKIREPSIKLAHIWRALDGMPGPAANGVHSTANFTLERSDEMFGQAVLQSGSVFNFYLPNNPLSAGSSLVSPEMQIMSESNLANTHNNYHNQVYRFNNRSDLTDDNPRVTTINLEGLTALARNPNNLLDWYNLVLFAGSMPDNVRDELLRYMRTLGNTNEDSFAKAQDTLFLILVSPSFHIQR